VACANGGGGGGGGEGGAAAGEVSPRRPPAGDGAGSGATRRWSRERGAGGELVAEVCHGWAQGKVKVGQLGALADELREWSSDPCCWLTWCKISSIGRNCSMFHARQSGSPAPPDATYRSRRTCRRSMRGRRKEGCAAWGGIVRLDRIFFFYPRQQNG
jgi:hypothetical protein